MNDILKKIYEERAGYSEEKVMNDPKYQEALKVFRSTTVELLAKMDSDSRKVFEEYIGASVEMAEIRSNEDFAEGFRIGSRFTYEILANL